MSSHNMRFSRRRWLQSSAAAAGVALLSKPRVTLADLPGKPKPLRLGLVTYNWAKDWDLPTIIANCTDTGFSGVELRTTHEHGVEISLDSRQRAEVRKRFRDSSITLIGLGSACEYHSADPAVVKRNIEESKAFVRLCHDVGGSGVKVRPNGFPAGVPKEQTLRQIGESLNEVARFAADYGVQIRLEVHGPGTSELPNTKAIMDIADHPNNMLCWNCNEEDLRGDGFAANYELVEDRIGTVHFHDLRKDNYPWAELFARLKRCDAPGFTSWTMLEEGDEPEDPLEAMRANRELWESLT